MKGGWDRPQDCARTLRERDGKDKPHAEGKDDNNNKYNEDGNIPNNSAAPAESVARLCPESQRTSVPLR
jgi:hypothetical protein